ncbi:MAG: amidohydrolase family protein, partial [Frankia sp.]
MTLIAGVLVYDHEGDVHQPVVRDIRVTGGLITAVTPPGVMPPGVMPPGEDLVDGRGMLCLPGFVNAHHHSYDVLARGLLEDMPFDLWALHSQPAYLGPRGRRELRVRTILGALECLRSGITTVQDMCSLVPFDEETLDTILDAYAEVGIRVVFSIAVRDVPELDIHPFLRDVPADVIVLGPSAAPPAAEQIAFVTAQLRRRPAAGLHTWALSPAGPQRATVELLEGLAALSADHDLPVFTHVYETKAQTAKARQIYPATDGSMIGHLREVGLLTARTNLVHAVWITPEELAEVAAAGSRIVHNPVSNMKLKSGIAPMARAWRAGVDVALGCDNCSCGDTHNMFQAMKGLCLLAGVSSPTPNGLLAHHAIRAATVTGARAARLDVGAIQVGAPADLVLLDINDLAYQPFNSAARQVVYAETGRGVRTVLVNGRVVLRDGAFVTVDEADLLAELTEVMPRFRADFTAAAARAR